MVDDSSNDSGQDQKASGAATLEEQNAITNMEGNSSNDSWLGQKASGAAEIEKHNAIAKMVALRQLRRFGSSRLVDDILKGSKPLPEDLCLGGRIEKFADLEILKVDKIKVDGESSSNAKEKKLRKLNRAINEIRQQLGWSHKPDDDLGADSVKRLEKVKPISTSENLKGSEVTIGITRSSEWNSGNGAILKEMGTVQKPKSKDDRPRLEGNRREFTRWLYEIWVNEGEPGCVQFFRCLHKYEGGDGSPLISRLTTPGCESITFKTKRMGAEKTWKLKTLQNKVGDFKRRKRDLEIPVNS